jgi:hypothetical protein
MIPVFFSYLVLISPTFYEQLIFLQQKSTNLKFKNKKVACVIFVQEKMTGELLVKLTLAVLFEFKTKFQKSPSCHYRIENLPPFFFLVS